MDKKNSLSLWQKEREIFEKYKQTNPKMLVLLDKPSEKEIFSRIGIKKIFIRRTEGYIRLFLQDFIVEEISKEKEISEIELKESQKFPALSHFTLYANLIKIGISTPEALGCLAEKAEVKINKIGYAGLKDVKAITSQKIAISNINLEIFKRIKESSFANFFLTNFSFGKETISAGDLFGNRFTIFIRSKEKINEKWFSENLDKIKKEGFLNFYQAQRFGTPRFLSHFLGKLILQGKYKEAIFTFLTKSGLAEIPLIKEFREEAKRSFENWEQMEKIFNNLPYTFRNELKLLSCLKKNPKNFIGALIFFKDQTTLWIYAYASYLFNLLLSLDKKIELPEEIPAFLSNDARDQKIYNPWLEIDEIKDFQQKIKPFPFIILKRRLIKTRVFPEKILFEILPEGMILNFALEKGAYATTFLMNLFEIEQGLPLPEWVKTKEYDIKKILGIGSIENVKKILGKDVFVPDFGF